MTSAPTWRRRELVLAALAALAGCGGGVDSGGTGTGSMQTYAAGPITGFGSVITHGVRYDETTAMIDADDGGALRASDLKLGMQIEVIAGEVVQVGGVSRASASSIRVRSDIVGRVEANDAATALVTVLGQAVKVTPTTVFDAVFAGGQAAIAVGTVVAVHATLDLAAGRYVATRIEPAAAATAFKLRGVVAELSAAGRTLRIGGATIDWSALKIADPATTLAVGRYLRVTLATTAIAGVWKATSVASAAPALEDRERAEVEGRITAFTSASRFAVAGIEVDASSADFPDGSAGLALGSKVEVLGKLMNGVLVAARVEIESDDGPEPFELHGVIEAVDTATQSFVVRSVAVTWSAATRFDSSTSADIVAGRRVEVKGALSSDGTRLDATRVHVER